MTKALGLSNRLLWATLLFFASALPLALLSAQNDAWSGQSVELYTAEELDNLLAPVALYPDPILAQVLVAATFPDQVELAARYVRRNGTDGIDEQPWDISVRALAHYAPVLNLMADRIDWTTALGQAHAMQAGDVMASVQQLRTMARAQGNLVTTREQEVVVRDRNIYIVPAQPRVVYVPTYDPVVVYYQPIVYRDAYRSGWSFGIGFPIGVWLNYDVDWHERRVYYHGWNPRRHRDGWYHQSRPYVVVNNIYVNPRHTTIIINRRVVDRHVNYDRMGRYTQIHRRTTWDRRRQYEDRRYASDDHGRNSGGSWDRSRDRKERGNGAADRTGNRRDGGPSWDRNETRSAKPARRDVARGDYPSRTASRTAQPVTQRQRTPRAVPSSERRAAPSAPRTQAQNPPRAQRQSEPRAQPRAPRAERQSEPRSATRSATRSASAGKPSGGRVASPKSEHKRRANN